MAQHKRIKREKAEELEEDSRPKKKASQPVYNKIKAADEGAVLKVELSVDKHAALLGEVSSDEHRASLVAHLQQSYGNAYVQRVMERMQAEKGSGRPLESETRSEMEAVFKRDFAVADNLARELGAEACTSGKDIYFRTGSYQPETDRGLLGHELTHVVQQEGSPQGAEHIDRAGDALEREAARVGQEVSEGRGVSVGMASAVPSLQRQTTTQEETTAQAAAVIGFDADAAARMRNEIMTPIEQAAEQGLAASPPDVRKAIDLIAQAIVAVSRAPFESGGFDEATAASMRNEVMTPLEQAGEMLSASLSAPERAMDLMAQAIVATSSLSLERAAG
jgi:hypothetical protein